MSLLQKSLDCVWMGKAVTAQACSKLTSYIMPLSILYSNSEVLCPACWFCRSTCKRSAQALFPSNQCKVVLSPA